MTVTAKREEMAQKMVVHDVEEDCRGQLEPWTVE
jgi:hypothetical protein